MSDIDCIRRTSGIIGNSDGIEQVLEMVTEVAPVDISVLITGESGTGKEIIAKAIHKASRRSSQPLVTVNCGAIPEGIIESELFGHRKGAFTGASDDRKGYFEEADRGTIFLDEIGETPVETQVKLLRVIESGEFMRVGDAKTRRVDVRVIAATNKDLMKETEKEAFRKDLYYRLRTVTIDVPPLRHRLDDLDLLADRFALEFSRSNDIVFRGFTSDALSVMKQYDWPGNVRELKNFVESIIIFERGNRISSDMVIKHLSPMVETVSGNLPVPVNKSTDQAERELILQQLLFLRQDMRDLKSMIGEDALDRSGEVGYLNPEGTVSNLPLAPLDPESMKSIRSSAIGEMSMNDFEREIITRTLKKFNKNRRKAAKVLGISERTLYRKINEYGLERKQKIKE
ncbi:MAG: sigma-54 dependent transcriptional regulator [Candidatus Marinimicrobia bacterium]|jgi:DNA-binding NtrC family response regulator|nr:sigma-54 dependent transcriptional regulator [Candidatus Neomarinimicrobiota bacterium]MDP6593195.1 sigma-54 dependent transcriptional regulator [Candidatus Neomarinimicrobiota bacterium]MDP6836000.1 sigma-54 dependent transcriptional regulator [Candidatus Neomarinimicrobiota bacterium]|tara:strand:+ start:2243 stop:3442 length:1200 start_codon:yes stop_codon:yes gene_type:complete